MAVSIFTKIQIIVSQYVATNLLKKELKKKYAKFKNCFIKIPSSL